MRSRQDLVLGAVIAVFGLVLIFWIIPSQVNDEGSFGLPPSLAPRALAWLMVGMGVVLMVQNFRPKVSEGERQGLAWPDVIHLITCVAALALMLLLMKAFGDWAGRPYAGFLVAAPIGLIAFTVIHKGAPGWAYAFNAIAAPAIIYMAFWWGLSLPLP